MLRRVYLYSNCRFGLEDDCEYLPTGAAIPPFPAPADPTNACEAALHEHTGQTAAIAFEATNDRLRTQFRETHYNACMSQPFSEVFAYQTSLQEYHYTLYYYDQAGNMVQSVPPEGVAPLLQGEVAQYAMPGAATIDPAHRMVSRFRYNSVNQIVEQTTPNSGMKRFWYNDAGQMRFSQNDEQARQGEYSYVKYDARARVTETGVVSGVSEPVIRAELNKRDFPPRPQYTLREVTTTVYDTMSHIAPCRTFGGLNLRGRVAAALAESPGRQAVVTCYSYDPHGNVASLLQVLPGLQAKRINYDYDLISGKVIATHYQPGHQDALHHRYTYDDDDRLVSVDTSRDQHTWERDAAYSYYKHGPLARLELGQNRVQGLDYTYTLQGWPKGVNAGSGQIVGDPGKDGDLLGPHPSVGADAFGMTLDYFHGDYTPIGLATGAFTSNSGPHPQGTSIGPAGFSASAFARDACGTQTVDGCGLYDGNVARMVAAQRSFMANGQSPLGFAFRYDQLYRIRSGISHLDFDATKNAWPASATTPNYYKTAFEYDANGNIKTLQRSAASNLNPPTSAMMDDLIFHYPEDAEARPTNDRLLHVNDSISAVHYADDIDDQGTFNSQDINTHNYKHDAVGNVVHDRSQGLDAIRWDARGRVVAIQKSDGSVLEFVYDAQGHRVVKITQPSADPRTWQYRYYIRDGEGKELSFYERQAVPGANPSLIDQSLYASERIGTWSSPSVPLQGGQKQYELRSYAGTVAATVSGRQAQFALGVAEPEILSSNDYYPFGSRLPGRIHPAPNGPIASYRYGFHALEKDDEVKGEGHSYYTSARLYDPRIGRWLSVDPVSVASVSPFNPTDHLS